MTVLMTVLDNSIAFSLLFGGVWLVKTSLKKHLSARLHYMIWAAVLVSLLIPVRIESVISLWNLLPKQTAETIILQTQNLQPSSEIVSGSNAVGEGIQPQNQPAAANNAPADPPAVSGHSEPPRTYPSKPAARIDWLAVLWAAWLAGVAAAILWLFLGGLRLRRHIIRCSLPETPSWLEACARECRKALNMRRNVRIVLQPVLPMPAVMGIFHPILAMPESIIKEGDGERVRHILMHELSHVKRGDLIVIALLNLISAVYWFNPLIWLCFKQIRADMETSCDNDVVNALGRSQRQEYIRTLVYFSGMGGRCTQAALSLHDARIQMKKRIGAMFMTKKTKPAIAVPVILLVIVLLLAASVTGCLPVEANGAALAGPSATATLGPASTVTPENTTEPSATNSPSVQPQTPEPSPSPSATPAVTPTAPAKTAETPDSAASQWENKYKPALDKYREFAMSFSQDGVGDFSDWRHPWDQIGPDVMLSTRKFGYAFRDMDGNGTPELFLLTSDGSIWAMYTVVDGAPKLLDTFWARKSCLLDKSDVVYTNWSNGALDWGQDAYRISKDGRELELIERVAMESTDENGNPLDKPRYYKSVGSESDKEIISQAEADAETSKFPKSNDNSGLEFIPLS